MSNSISITTEALAKTHLHSFKHHASTVNGILLGKADKNSILVTDIIPLFHTHTLLPMFEVAMIQIEKYCRDNNIDMVGYYHSNQCLSNDEVEPIAKKIAERLHNELNNSCFLMVSKIEDNNNSGLILIDRQGSDSWVKNKKSLISIDNTKNNEDIKTILKRNLSTTKESQLFDFEEYLSNPTRDWLNKTLVL